MKENFYMEKEMEKERNMIVKVISNLKGNFLMERNGTEKEKYIIICLDSIMKENIWTVKYVVKEKNIILEINYYLKVNFLMEKNGMEKDTIKIIMLFMNWIMEKDS